MDTDEQTPGNRRIEDHVADAAGIGAEPGDEPPKGSPVWSHVPAQTAVARSVQSVLASDIHAIRIRRIDGDGVRVLAVDRRTKTPGLAVVIAAVQANSGGEDRSLVG